MIWTWDDVLNIFFYDCFDSFFFVIIHKEFIIRLNDLTGIKLLFFLRALDVQK